MAGAAKLDPSLHLVEDPYTLAEGADALLVCTEWNEFKNLDLQRIKQSMVQPIMVDGRNIYDPAQMDELGFIYRGVGRGSEVTYVIGA